MEVVLRVTLKPNPKAERHAGPIVMEVTPASGTDHGQEEGFFYAEREPQCNMIIDPSTVAQAILDLFNVWHGADEYWTIDDIHTDEA